MILKYSTLGITQLTSLLSKWMEEIPFSSSRITVWTNSELMIWITSCTLTILHNPLPHWTSACQHKRQYSPLFRKALFNLNLMVTEKLCCFCIENLQLKEQRTFKLLKTFTFLIIWESNLPQFNVSERNTRVVFLWLVHAVIQRGIAVICQWCWKMEFPAINYKGINHSVWPHSELFCWVTILATTY